MTKDGRPSRINDIRYFHGASPRGSGYLPGHADAVAFGRRLAWLLNGEGFSLGAYPSLYILFTPSLPAGAVHVTDSGGDWWQRYTNVGVPVDFPDTPEASRIVTRGTVAALKAIRPDLTTSIEEACETVLEHGDDLRFLIKTRQTKRFRIDVSFSISVWPASSFLFVSLTDLASGEIMEAPPRSIEIYHDAFYLAGTITLTDTVASILPNQSVAATLASARHGGPLNHALSEFLPRTRPAMSKLVKRLG